MGLGGSLTFCISLTPVLARVYHFFVKCRGQSELTEGKILKRGKGTSFAGRYVVIEELGAGGMGASRSMS